MLGDSLSSPEQESTTEPISEDLIDGSPNSTPKADHNLNLAELQQSVRQLQQSFDQKIKYDAHKEQLIDRLHQELQTYKDGLQEQQIRPLLLDIIQTIDEVNKLIMSYQNYSPEDLDPTKLLKQLQTFPDDLKAILYRQGVDSYQNYETAFDAQRHRVLKREETQDAALDKKIAHSLREGYLWREKVLRPELVSVYRFTAPTTCTKETTHTKESEHESTEA